MRKRREIPWLATLNDVFYVYWYDGKRTQRTSLGTKDAVEAQARYAAFLAQGHAAFRAVNTGGLTIDQALYDYLREHVHSGDVVDVDRQERACERLREFWKEGALLADVDIPASRLYVQHREKAGASSSTIRRELGVLIAAANHARRWKRLPELPSIELPDENQKAHEEALFLTKEELEAARAAADPETRDFIDLCYYTASRRGAIERMLAAQVNLVRGTINLTSPQETAAQRRSKKRRPVVPIDAKLRPVLEALLERRRDHMHLFGRSMYMGFRRACLAAGIDEARAHPHILRHSRATHLLQGGASIWDVAKLLGDTVRTTEAVYGHHCPSHLAAVLARQA